MGEGCLVAVPIGCLGGGLVFSLVLLPSSPSAVAGGGGRDGEGHWWGGGVGRVFSLLFVLVVRVSDRFSHTNMPVVDRGGASVGALSYVMKCFTTQISKGRW